MPNATGDIEVIALEDEDEDEVLDCECDESDSWMWIFYHRRKDAFRAIRAADLLGISCSMNNRWESGPDQTETQWWVVELKTTGCLPEGANSSITKHVA